uniref:Secreted protein n=1 Tax=Oryza punctata TaxID=4537 RepID=A0A0E0JSP3_ORYPU
MALVCACPPLWLCSCQAYAYPCAIPSRQCCIGREGAVGTAETTRWLISLVCTRTRDNITAENQGM